jgi:hypothetical protein
VSFNIGVGDTYTNQNWVNFPANTTAYGLVRNGDWAQGTIPISTLLGPKVALQSLLDVFMISSDANNLPASTFQFAIDDIVYDSGTTTTPPPPTERAHAAGRHHQQLYGRRPEDRRRGALQLHLLGYGA